MFELMLMCFCRGLDVCLRFFEMKECWTQIFLLIFVHVRVCTGVQLFNSALTKCETMGALLLTSLMTPLGIGIGLAAAEATSGFEFVLMSNDSVLMIVL